MKKREYACITATRKGERWLKGGHPWLYESDIDSVSGEYENGDIVDVLSVKGNYIGSGLVSDNSKIRVRLISRDYSITYNEEFWERRIRYAWNYRKTVLKDQLDCCRVIFGESDGFPGLTVDRFNDILVTQVLTFGMDKLKETIFPLLLKALKEDGQDVKGIFERNDVNIRKLEGLTEYKGWFCKEEGLGTETVITENGIKYYVDVENGQKTGFFLDQKRNRERVGKLVEGKKVLDCFSHTGSFALNCAKGKAAKVTAVDISETAIKQAQRNADLNDLKVDFVVADVFDYLDKVNKKEYDFIILDPPAFTKSRQTVNNAYNGYLDINSRAMKLLPKGGYLATCSCSHFMPHELFEKMLREASEKTGIQMRMVSVSQQGEDHPIMLNVPETDYLKFYILQIV